MTNQEFIFKFNLIKATKHLDAAVEAVLKLHDLTGQIAETILQIKSELDSLKAESATAPTNPPNSPSNTHNKKGV